MYCEKCGAPLPKDARFCGKCGARVTQTPSSSGTDPAGEKASGRGPESKPQKTKIPKKFLWIGIAAIVVIVAAIVLLALRPWKSKMINLNHYIQVEYSGYNTLGQADWYFDYAAFQADYGDKLDYSEDAKQILDDTLFFSSFLEYTQPVEWFEDEEYLGSLDPSGSLSNGDVLTFSWEFDEIDQAMLQSGFNYSFRYSDMEFTVSGLEEAETFDPFAELSVTFTGISSDGMVSIQNNAAAPPASALTYSVTPADGLSNGETVTVSIDNLDLTSLVNAYGMVPSATSKDYTVEGLSEYATTLNEIPEETLQQIQAQCEDVIASYVANKWNADDVSVADTTYLGSYLLVPKVISGYIGNNLTMVYQIRVHEYHVATSSWDDSIDSYFNLYYPIRFYDLILEPDGSCTVNLGNYDTTGNSFSHYYTYHSYYYYGYEDLAALYSDYVTKSLEYYTYESSVADSDTGAESISSEPEETTDTDEYILPDSSTRELTVEDLQGLSQEQLRLARNEIYALEGRKFQDEDLQAYFDSKSWYQGTIEPGEFTDDMLSDIERANVNLISDYEKEMGYS